MASKSDCIFCKIVAGDVPSSTVYEDEAVRVFMDVGPLAEGHLLVIPRDHCAEITSLTPDQAASIGRVLPVLGRALLKVTGAEGFNVLCNQGTVAGQVVMHVHFHLIPRVTGDALGYRWNSGTYPAGRAEELATAVCEALAEDAI